ncbi:MAG: tetratricopeptide repeat protein [Acidobacteriota bacterium]
MELSILPNAKRLRRVWFEWPESCYERFNLQSSEDLDELFGLALSPEPPSVVVLAGPTGIGRGYLCRAIQHRAQASGSPLGLWDLDLQGFEPEGQHPLADFLGQLIGQQERDQAASREKAAGAIKSTAKALSQTELPGQASEWAAALLSLLWQFEDPVGRFIELLQQTGYHQVAPRDDPETLRRLLDELTRQHKLLIHVRDAGELSSPLRRWLIRQTERAPERLLLVLSYRPDRATRDVASYCRHPPTRIDVQPLTMVQLRQALDRCLDPHALPQDFLDVLVRQSRGRPGLIANWLADLVEWGALETDASGVWRLPEDGVADPRVLRVFSTGLFEEVDRRIAEESPERQKTLREFLVLAALGGSNVPLAPLFGHLKLDEEECEAVTDFLDDVLDEELGWLSDCGFRYPSFPGFNVYTFNSRLLPPAVLDQIPQIEREMRAVTLLRFLEEHAQPAKRGMAKWFLEIAGHLGDRERRPYEHLLAWWCMQEDAEALRDEIRAALEGGELKPEVVWEIAQTSDYWPPFRRLALLDAYEELLLDEAEDDGGVLSIEQLASFRILRSGLRYRQGLLADALEDALQAQPLVEEGSLGEATVLNLAGMARLGLGQAEAARTDLQSAHTLFKPALGPGHPEILNIESSLAATYVARGNYGQAKKLAEAVWHASSRTLGPEHPFTLTSQGNLAAIYRAQGQLPKARELYDSTWRVSRRVLGSDHPDTVRSRDLLELTLQKIAGRAREAS